MKTPDDATSTKTKKFEPCPEESCKLVWLYGASSHKLYEPTYRAFHSRGFSVTHNRTRAHYLITDQPWNVGDEIYDELTAWQRYNFLRFTTEWDDKDKMAQTMNEYYSQIGKTYLHSFPEAYVLHTSSGLEAYEKRLSDENGGLDIPWVLKVPDVNQGQGVTILPPHSDELKGVVEMVKAQKTKNSEGRLVVQRYICDEMTYYDRKFDVRVYWAVISIDPVVVLYQTEHNFVRVGHTVYDESKMRNSTTTDHKTTHTFKATEIKATWDEMREKIERHVFGSESKFRERFSRDKYDDEETLETVETILKDPFRHVQNQMKTVIGHLVDAYKNITFHGRGMKAENAFTWHAADMIIDNNLDVYIIEGTDGPGKDEDYDFRIRMHNEQVGTLIDMVEEVTSLQVEGRPLDVSALKEKGIMGAWEVAYNDGWFMDYRYKRLPVKECSMGTNSNNNISPDDKAKNLKRLSLPSREIVPATFTALPRMDENPKNDDTPKTFWTRSRTNRMHEPIARSLRRNGWMPVDLPQDAQVLFDGEEYDFKQYPNTPQPWQWISQFPSSFSFFEGKHSKYLDVQDKGKACRPIQHKKRPLEAIVYWLVLSLDPLIVLYHDGFLYYKYSKHDENEFFDLPKQDETTEMVWKGSWKVFEHYLNVAHATVASFAKSEAATAAAGISLDPTGHVRNQMKAAIVKMATGLANYTAGLDLKDDNYKSYALYFANFQVDRNLNVFFRHASHSYIKGEDHGDVVTMHNSIYGSAFKLLEYVNATSAKSPIDEDHEKEILGKYEWLVRPDVNASNNKPWSYKYDWKYKAMECFN
jgi:hypothetical protein